MDKLNPDYIYQISAAGISCIPCSALVPPCASLNPKVPGGCHGEKCHYYGSAKGMVASFKSFGSGNRVSSLEKNK